MKKSIKAIVAMVLVLALGFAMLSTTAFAASAASDIAVPQSAGIRDFFSSIFKKIADTVKNIIDKILPSTPDPEPEEPTTTGDSFIEGEIVIDDGQYGGNGVGGNDQYAGGIW